MRKLHYLRLRRDQREFSYTREKRLNADLGSDFLIFLYYNFRGD